MLKVKSVDPLREEVDHRFATNLSVGYDVNTRELLVLDRRLDSVVVRFIDLIRREDSLCTQLAYMLKPLRK
jgi:hypothetical protein